MKNLLVNLLVCCALIGSPGLAGAKEKAKRGTPAEAEVMVKKAVALIKAEGKEKAFARIDDSKGSFVDRDLYISVFDMNGVCVAHGFNAKMIGKNMIDLKDPTGRAMVKERVERARTESKFWQRDYAFVDPLSKTIMKKDMYVERIGDVVVCCGVFKG
jgi:cytochrome c